MPKLEIGGILKNEAITSTVTRISLFVLLLVCATGSFASGVPDSLTHSDSLIVTKPEIVSNSKNWSKYCDDRKGMPITTIVLHASFDPKHPEDLTYRRLHKIWDRYHASANFVIEPDGCIIEMVPVTEAARHALYSKPNHNPFSIGIELLHVWNGEGSERIPYSIRQLESCRTLVKWLRTQFAITTVTSHRAISTNGKKDPNMTPDEWKIAADNTTFPDPWPRTESSWEPDPKDR